jgi:chromosomal replication initiator protein
VYVSGDRFARQYSITARRRQGDRFREFYRRADLLVIDDAQDIAGKQGTERELCFTLDHLITANKQVVLAACAPPKRLAQLQRGLEGRLLSGLVVGIEGPDRETRREVIRARSAAAQLELNEPVTDLLVSGFGENMRELLSALTRLEAHRRHVGSPLALETVKHMLSDLLQDRIRPASLEGLAGFVAERLETPIPEQQGRSRKALAVRARQLAMALARELTPHTLREIGAYFGNRSCGSVHSAHQRFSQLRDSDPQVKEIWETARGLFTRPACPPQVLHDDDPILARTLAPAGARKPYSGKHLEKRPPRTATGPGALSPGSPPAKPATLHRSSTAH